MTPPIPAAEGGKVKKPAKRVVFTQVYDGEWIEPTDQLRHPVRCCDCGLTHVFAFRVSRGKVQFMAVRDEKATRRTRQRFIENGQKLAITVVDMGGPDAPWRDMRTAKESTEIVLFATRNGVRYGSWNKTTQEWQDTKGRKIQPSHWMPVTGSHAPHAD